MHSAMTAPELSMTWYQSAPCSDFSFFQLTFIRPLRPIMVLDMCCDELSEARLTTLAARLFDG